MKKIKLTQGKYTLVDDVDFERLNQFKWYYNAYGYAERSIGGRKDKKNFRIHSFIVGIHKGKDIDHINGDRLDNRRSNLRVVTHQQNLLNSILRKDNTSGFKGVSWSKTYKKFRSYITFNKKTIDLGLFKNKEDAINSRKLASLKYHGKFAKI